MTDGEGESQWVGDLLRGEVTLRLTLFRWRSESQGSIPRQRHRGVLDVERDRRGKHAGVENPQVVDAMDLQPRVDDATRRIAMHDVSALEMGALHLHVRVGAKTRVIASDPGPVLDRVARKTHSFPVEAAVEQFLSTSQPHRFRAGSDDPPQPL